MLYLRPFVVESNIRYAPRAVTSEYLHQWHARSTIQRNEGIKMAQKGFINKKGEYTFTGAFAGLLEGTRSFGVIPESSDYEFLTDMVSSVISPTTVRSFELLVGNSRKSAETTFSCVLRIEYWVPSYLHAPEGRPGSPRTVKPLNNLETLSIGIPLGRIAHKKLPEIMKKFYDFAMSGSRYSFPNIEKITTRLVSTPKGMTQDATAELARKAIQTHANSMYAIPWVVVVVGQKNVLTKPVRPGIKEDITHEVAMYIQSRPFAKLHQSSDSKHTYLADDILMHQAPFVATLPEQRHYEDKLRHLIEKATFI